MQTRPLEPKLVRFSIRHALTKKLAKQIKLLEENPKHPSLNTEKLEPRDLGFYSFRIDRKYRAIFHILPNGEAQIIDINDHYQ